MSCEQSTAEAAASTLTAPVEAQSGPNAGLCSDAALTGGGTEDLSGLLFSHSPIGLQLCTRDGRLTEVNPALCAIVGEDADDVRGRMLWELVPEAQHDALRRRIDEVVHGHATEPYETEYRHRDGRIIAVRLHSRFLQCGGERLVWSCVEDVSERRWAEMQLQYAARRDALTGLPNRRWFMDELERALQRRADGAAGRFAVLFLDFDRFKLINDSLGHQFGDLFLCKATRRLQMLAETTPANVAVHVARLGGDEFTLLVDPVHDESGLRAFLDRVTETLSRPYYLNGCEAHSAASIGVVLGHDHYATGEELIRDADTAMYAAKKAGRGCYVFFDRRMHEAARAELELENYLRHALRRDELRLEYQPVIVLETGLVSGFEALLRWEHPRLGRVPPDRFIPLAEENGQIVPIGRWVLQECCRQLATWALRFEESSISVNVNVSKRQLVDPEFLTHVIDATTGLPSGALRLEVTESIVMETEDTLLQTLAGLRAAGIDLLMDDFGTGHSSLSRLSEFPISTIKIDRMFVRMMPVNRQIAAIINAIVTLARDLEMAVIAEGVETSEQLSQLLALGCAEGQGYYFAAPMSVRDAEWFWFRHSADGLAIPVW